MTYLLLVYSIINTQRHAVQALIVVPTRELGMQVRNFNACYLAVQCDCLTKKRANQLLYAILFWGGNYFMLMCCFVLIIKVTKVARMLAAKPIDTGDQQKSCTVMALLDGGLLKRHKTWLKVPIHLFKPNCITFQYTITVKGFIFACFS